MSYDNIPDELRTLRQWLCWRTEHRTNAKGETVPTKVPYQPRMGKLRKADATDPSTWGTFDEAVRVAGFIAGIDGIGFVFTRDDPYIGFDLDGWDDNWTEDILELSTYTERSPSGNGLHLIGRGTLPIDTSGKHPKGLGIFQHSRFFTMTGDIPLPDLPPAPISDVQAFIDANWTTWFPEKATTTVETTVATDADDAILARLQAEQSNGKFQALWQGDISAYDDDQSAADLALCSKIAFYTQDPAQISRIFSQSGLMRDKWMRDDYRDATIGKALQREEVYTPMPEVVPFHGTSTSAVETPVAAPAATQMSDLGNAERLAWRHAGAIRYCHPWDTWLIWDGKRFQRDESGEIYRRAKETIRAMYAEAADEDDEKVRKAISRHAMKSESATRVRAMIDLARHEETVAVAPSALDADPWLFNVANGMVDLRTGTLHPHDPARLMTRMSPAHYTFDADCPAWMAFLDRIMDGNTELIGFLQRAAGYSMTGSVQDQCMFILHGNGQNGKTTFLNLIDHVMGDYHQTVPAERLLVRHGDSTIANDLARLAGARFARTSETTDGKRFDEAMVKTLTGDEPIPVRLLHKEFFDLIPQFKLWMATNYKPVIRGTDKGIWRRIHLIPFTVQIPDTERDPTLPAKLRQEAPGILNWMLQGCLDWQARGLVPPQAVADAGQGYREEMDVFGRFLADCCEIGPEHHVLADHLYATYKSWAADNGEYQMTQTAFGRKLAELGIEKKQHYNGVRGRSWVGITTTTTRPQDTPGVVAFPSNPWVRSN